jgi:inner membrane protein involved in colicin E2 resistance
MKPTTSNTFSVATAILLLLSTVLIMVQRSEEGLLLLGAGILCAAFAAITHHQ